MRKTHAAGGGRGARVVIMHLIIMLSLYPLCKTASAIIFSVIFWFTNCNQVTLGMSGRKERSVNR